MDGLENVQELRIETPYGDPSAELLLGRIGELEVVFLARHGRHHSLSPTEVPYRANVWALRSLGVRWILPSRRWVHCRANPPPGHAGAGPIH